MNNEETVKRLKELIDEIEAKPKVEESQEHPEYNLVRNVHGSCRVQFGSWHVTGWQTAKAAAEIANALNSFGAMKAVCAAIKSYEAESVNLPYVMPFVDKALSLAAYGDDGRLKDG